MFLRTLDARNEGSVGWRRGGGSLTWGCKMGIDQQRREVIEGEGGGGGEERRGTDDSTVDSRLG